MLEFSLITRTNRGTLLIPPVTEELKGDQWELVFNWIRFLEPTEIHSAQLLVRLVPEEAGEIVDLYRGEEDTDQGAMKHMDGGEIGCWVMTFDPKELAVLN